MQDAMDIALHQNPTRNRRSADAGDADVFERFESCVRSYCRRFPAVFSSARGACLYDEAGNEYIDFFCGAGALNYGHNEPSIKEAVLDYLHTDGIIQSLDLHTPTKREFLARFEREILRPRGYCYKVQFAGPAGTNAVEAALKLARKVTGRRNVVAFSNAFHGMSLGALGVSARAWKRSSAGMPLDGVTRMPFDGFLGEGVDSIAVIERLLFGRGSGVDHPAAFILETVQAEGGLNVASTPWLHRLEALAREHDVLLIVDDIQAGCGRTGRFFSFEHAGIEPDLVCLSKSISGFGLPLSLVLIAPHLDRWEPGEHNATFRGNSLAFVAGAAALSFWQDPAFERGLSARASQIGHALAAIHDAWPEGIEEVRGLGLLQGIAFADPRHATAVSRRAYDLGLIVELCGPRDEVVKVMPPLTIDEPSLTRGLRRLGEAVEFVRDETRLAPVLTHA